jgi:hypothetical protein
MMNSFFDLQKSKIMADQVRFTIMNGLVIKIFGVNQIEQGKIYQYNTKLETQENHQWILENWDVLFFDEKPDKRCKTNHRLVYWTIDRMINAFNDKYHPTTNVTFDRIIHSQRNKDEGTRGTVTHYELKLI